MRTTLNGYVVADDDAWIYEYFGYSVISPQKVRDAVKAAEEKDEELTLEVNSGGGSVFAGFEIYSVLQNAKVRTVAEVQSLAASAASTIILGCQVVRASPVAQIMIHLPSTVTEGDRTDHLRSVGILDSLTRSILAGYVAKSAGKRTEDQLMEMIRRETWMTAADALDAGLIDEVIGQETVPTAIVNAFGGLPDAEALKAIWRDKHPEEAASITETDPLTDEASATDSWLDGAAIELERQRFI